MDGQPRMEHVRPVLQGGGAAEYHEAELAFPEAGLEVDAEYMAFRYPFFVHGALHLDLPSLRGVYHGE